MLFLPCAWALDVPSSDYPTLRDAVEAASNDDIIYVDPAYEPEDALVSIDKELEIRSSITETLAPVEALEIKSKVDLYDLRVASHSEGHLIARNELSAWNLHFTSSGDPKLVAEATVTVTGLVIDGHEAGDSQNAAVRINGDVTLKRCILRNSKGPEGFDVGSDSNLELQFCTVEDNTFTHSTIVSSGANVTIDRTLFSGNRGESNSHGGAVTVNAGRLVVTESRFENNSSPDRGGDLWIDNAETSINRFESHQATSGRGASIYVVGASLTVRNARFTQANPSVTATVFSKGSSTLNIERSQFCATAISGNFEQPATEVRVSGESTLKLQNVIISAGQGDAVASIVSTGTGTLRLDHVTAQAGEVPTLIVGLDPALEFFNTIADGYTTVVSVNTANSFAGSHNLLHGQNTVMQTAYGEGPLAGDPDSFYDQVPGFDSWTPNDCSDLPILGTGSAALGTASDTNWAGEPSDIGGLSGEDGQHLFTWVFGGGADAAADPGADPIDSAEPTPPSTDSGDPASPPFTLGPLSGGCASTGRASYLAGLTLMALAAVRRRTDAAH